MLALPSHANEGSEFTMAVLGCGTMGIAILSGILSSLADLEAPKPIQSPMHNSTTDPLDDPLPTRLPSRFIACVRRTESAKRVKKALWAHSSIVKVVQRENVAAVSQAEVILLACKPSMVSELLGEPGMSKALHGKLLISICVGVTTEQIETVLHGAVPQHDPEVDGRCRVVRAIPNTAAQIRESMTVVALSEPPLPMHVASLVTWIFRRIGDVVYLPPNTMDASTALCGAGPAFFSLMMEAAVDGAVAMGVPRPEATRMAAQAMRGTASLVQAGEHPAILRDKISTPGGCTIGGLLVLEEGRVRGTISRAVREATVVASQIGKGRENVNGTRFPQTDNGGF
ncbi:pyrroline-5-carboxylate reductase [Apiospora saccharicola]|uniref:Pyrroline-5-carboxylate reductase n=1 Tax=Apiospora saccharicola TaxID=335842 RepID=A0ABR1TL50_9PEZI